MHMQPRQDALSKESLPKYAGSRNIICTPTINGYMLAK